MHLQEAHDPLSNVQAHLNAPSQPPAGVKSGEDVEDPVTLSFTHRKVLNKKYQVAMCHGSRLVCDFDVYNKSFELIQQLHNLEGIPHKVFQWCSYDREYLIGSTIEYSFFILKWEVDLG